MGALLATGAGSKTNLRRDLNLRKTERIVNTPNPHAQAIRCVRSARNGSTMLGYAASASIPTCFSAHVQNGRIRKGDLVLSMAVGAGFNWAGALYYF